MRLRAVHVASKQSEDGRAACRSGATNDWMHTARACHPFDFRIDFCPTPIAPLLPHPHVRFCRLWSEPLSLRWCCGVFVRIAEGSRLPVPVRLGAELRPCTAAVSRWAAAASALAGINRLASKAHVKSSASLGYGETSLHLAWTARPPLRPRLAPPGSHRRAAGTNPPSCPAKTQCCCASS